MAAFIGYNFMTVTPRDIVDLYEHHARDYDRDRSRALQERAWLDRFLAHVPSGGTILDVGCGSGEPIARYLIEGGFRVTGVDASPSMIELCRTRFPQAEWLLMDMRALELGRRFDAVIAWDSFFHLTRDEQRAMFPRFAAHARDGAPLLFTSGSEDGEAIGSWFGEELYHASLASAEYERLLGENGFSVVQHVAHDVECGDHTVWLAAWNGD